MKKINYLFALAAASLMLGVGPAVAAPLDAGFMRSPVNNPQYIAPSHDAVARADAPLGLNLVDNPDIVAQFLDVSYNADLDSLNVSGFALNYVDPAGNSSLINPPAAFLLSATIDETGFLAAGGTFDVDGLLSGTLVGLGYSAIGGTLEFLFNVDGGSLAADYGGIGASGGMIMTFTGFEGDWNTDFASGMGQVNISPLAAPEPGILLLGGLGLTLIAASRRRKA